MKPVSRKIMTPLRVLLSAIVSCSTVLAKDPFLKASGTDLRNARGTGDTVVLRGANLGGWLEWQEWMCPIDVSKTLRDANPGHNGYDFEVRSLLDKRFGPAVADDLVAIYEENWITGADLDHLRSFGFNAVRLPFGYATLIDSDGNWRKDAFHRLDWCVREAWRRGMYTILDFHAFLPQSADQHGGRDGYWSNQAQLAETVHIWIRVAEHFRNNPAVACYDLLNEPNNSAPRGQAGPEARQILAMYHRLYHAIRSVDPDHAITMEGIWDWRSLRDPREAGYQNVIYSFHWYHWDAKDTAGRKAGVDSDVAAAREMFKAWNVPAFIGEFNLFGDREAWRYGVQRYNEAGLSWTIWTSKHKNPGTQSWGLLNPIKGRVPRTPDLTKDSADAIRASWKAWRTTAETYAPNTLFDGILPGVAPNRH